MSGALQKILRQALRDALCQVSSVAPVSGGCINHAQKVTLTNGQTYFVKKNDCSLQPMFAAEAVGLRALQETNSLPVPLPIGAGTLNESAYLVLEWIEPFSPTASSSAKLGRGLAELHQAKHQTPFGFEIDNFIGNTPQNNGWQDNWVSFLINRRFEPQFTLAREKGYSLRSDRLLSQLEKLIDPQPQPSLIHGDLWSGNFMIGPGNQPYLIDPAPYWGDREAEFGILTMFGGFDSTFFAAYEEAMPFADGFEDRLPLYQLYHYLNHLNLFGSSYLGSCESILARYA